MKTRTYQIALLTAMTVCVLLTATLVHVLLPRYRWASQAAESPVVARGSAMSSQSADSEVPVPAGTEPALAAVQLSPQRMQEIGVTLATVELKNVNDQLSEPGTVDMDEEHLSYVQTRFPGWIQDVFANADYQFVRKGQRLFTVYSPELVSSEQEYLLARQSQKVFSQDAHGMAAHESGWLLQAAAERLRQFGVPEQAITNLERSGKVQRDIAIDSPASGYIIERNALPNAYVQPDTKLYTIADLSTVWVYANVFQNDVGRLKPGDPAQVTVDAYPGRQFNGHIDQVLPQVDPTTRTVRVRLIFSNPGVVLKPGMYVNVVIAVPLGRHLVIPSSAVLQTGSRAIAFINRGNGNLEPRTIETGPQLDDSVIVLHGLKAGEQVVSSANFLVDSEAQLQQALQAFSPLPQSSSASAKAESAPSIQIHFSTQPNPPHQGSNTVSVQLTGADGKPIIDAQVTATFVMPAMPAMGMAAKHAAATLTSKGTGVYEGQLQLESGGTWQVNVAAQRDGEVVATQQITIDATGGM